MENKRIMGKGRVLHTAIGLTLIASLVGMSACSNETEDVTLDSNDVLVVDESDEVIESNKAESSTDNPVLADESANENNKKTDDTVMINESNENLEKTSAEGLQ